MWNVLEDRRYRHLFLAQIVALAGTGLATVALGLLAYDLAGERAALVLGTVFTIKMVAYVGVAPLAGALAERIDRRRLLVGLDLVRAAAAVSLPFVNEVWQVYLLIFAMQAASAGFTPAFQATIPDLLPEETRYTQALSLSRLAYELENIVSPLLAGILLTIVSHDALFLGTALGFFGSALLVVSVTLPKPELDYSASRGVYERTTRGMRIYLATPRLRGLLALCLSVSAAGSMVLVNSVVLVRSELGLPASALAWAMCAFGVGSMIAALALPRLLESVPDRPVMLAGAVLMGGVLATLALVNMAFGMSWGALLLTWGLVGLGYSGVMTPSGRLLKRSARSADRPALFAAQFALSHACWLVSYPLSGWLMTRFGTSATLLILAGIAVLGCLAALRLWPTADDTEVEHIHDNLPLSHPHLNGERRHRHTMIIDDEHPHWSDHYRR
jgi:H+ antiporter protein